MKIEEHEWREHGKDQGIKQIRATKAGFSTELPRNSRILQGVTSSFTTLGRGGIFIKTSHTTQC